MFSTLDAFFFLKLTAYKLYKQLNFTIRSVTVFVTILILLNKTWWQHDKHMLRLHSPLAVMGLALDWFHGNQIPQHTESSVGFHKGSCSSHAASDQMPDIISLQWVFKGNILKHPISTKDRGGIYIYIQKEGFERHAYLCIMASCPELPPTREKKRKKEARP